MKKPPKDGPDKMRPDIAETAYRVMLEATGQAPKTRPGERQKNPNAVKLGLSSGTQGGKARARKLDAARRSEIAKKAAAARWKDRPEKSE